MAASILLAGCVSHGVSSRSAPASASAQNIEARQICIANLRHIDDAKHIWADEHHKKPEDIPSEADLIEYLVTPGHPSFPICPLHGSYDIRAVGELPTCSVPGHSLGSAQ